MLDDSVVRATGGRNLPHPKKAFLDVDSVVRELTSATEPLDYVPRGVKEDQFFLVDNSENITRCQQGKQGQYWDDCGAWQSNSARGQKTTYVYAPGQPLKTIVLRDGQYCVQRQKNRKTVFVPVDPQPAQDSLIVVQRYYQKHSVTFL